jgi:hypothetical protein
VSSTDPAQIKAINDAWSLGYLEWKLRDYQRPVYHEIWRWIMDPECRSGCANISRRWGKSTVFNLVVTEFAQRVPGANIRFGAPTGQMLKDFTLPIMKDILRDCPKQRRPRWMSKDKTFLFPNGSIYKLAGLNDGHADDLRGTKCHLGGVDEAGFVDDLNYAIRSVLMPQTLDTGGTLLVSSTPPRSMAHPYVEFATKCAEKGAYIRRDIHSTDYSKKLIDSYAEEAGGYGSTDWRREYLAEFVTDSNLAIVPEWDDKYIRAPEQPGLYRYYHKYTAMDIGVRDLTAGLHAYYDYLHAKLIVEAEFTISGRQMTTPMIAALVKDGEKKIWGDNPLVYRRVADNNNLQLINDLNILHSLGFYGTSKDELPAMVNKLRVWIKSGRLIVSPKCEKLIGCLQGGIWKSDEAVGKEFGRIPKYGHFDHLAALIYLVRNVDEFSNPVPAGIGLDPQKQFILPGALDRASDTAKAVKEIFRLRK